MTDKLVPLTDGQVKALIDEFRNGTVHLLPTAVYLALAVQHAMTDHKFQELYGTMAVNAIHEACQ